MRPAFFLLLLFASCGPEVRTEVDPRTGLLEISEWSDGHRHGTTRTFHPDGKPAEEATFEHGVRVGKRTLWHDTGRKQVEGVYIDGVRDGPWPEWHANGRPRWTGAFRMGVRHGTWVEFDETGRKLAEETWEDGTRVSVVEFGATRARDVGAPAAPAPPATDG